MGVFWGFLNDCSSSPNFIAALCAGFLRDLSSHFQHSNWYELGTRKGEIAQCRKKRLTRSDQLSKPMGAKPLGSPSDWPGSIGVVSALVIVQGREHRSISYFSLGPEEGNRSGWGCASG